MIRQRIWTAALAVIALLSAAPPVPAQPGTNLPFVTVAAGAESGIGEPARLVIRDAPAWAAAWRRHAGQTAEPQPSVDFGREMVVAVFAGRSRTPVRATIHRITAAEGKLTVWYSVRETRPLPDGEGPASRAAFHIVRLGRSTLPVEFSILKLQQVHTAP